MHGASAQSCRRPARQQLPQLQPPRAAGQAARAPAAPAPPPHLQHVHALARAHGALARHEAKRLAAAVARARQREQRRVGAGDGVADLAHDAGAALLLRQPFEHAIVGHELPDGAVPARLHHQLAGTSHQPLPVLCRHHRHQRLPAGPGARGAQVGWLAGAPAGCAGAAGAAGPPGQVAGLGAGRLPGAHLNRRKACWPLPNQLSCWKSCVMREWLPLASLVMMAAGVVSWRPGGRRAGGGQASERAVWLAGWRARCSTAALQQSWHH
jgi:hypothetical protein